MSAIMTIWKFVLRIEDIQTIEVPRGFWPLHVAEQHGQLCLWASVVANSQQKGKRIIRIAGTGGEISAAHQKHLGTVLMHGGDLVWHVFDCGWVREAEEA